MALVNAGADPNARDGDHTAAPGGGKEPDTGGRHGTHQRRRGPQRARRGRRTPLPWRRQDTGGRHGTPQRRRGPQRTRRGRRHTAALGGGQSQTEVVTALVNAGADPNARDGDGFTPLHAAAAARAPVNAGADPNVRDGGGRTPFELIPEDSPLKGTDVYWRLNEGRFR